MLPTLRLPPPVQAQPQDYEAGLRQARDLATRRDTRGALALLRPWMAEGRRDALLAGATYLAWSGRYRESLGTLDPWLAKRPGDGEALLLRAQVLAWSGRWAEAGRSYDALLAQPPTAGEARLGLARLALWRGDPIHAREQMDALPPERRGAPDARLLEAQVQAALGRPGEARSEVRALAGLPGLEREAEPVLRSLDDRLGPWAEAGYSRTGTSEGLSVEAPSLRARLPLGDAALDLGWTDTRVRLGSTEARPAEARLGAAIPMGPRWTLSGDVRHVREVDGGATGFGFHAAFAPAPGWNLDYGHERSFVLVTPAAVALGTAFSSDALGLQWRLSGRQTLALEGDRASLSAGSIRTSYRADYRFELPLDGLQWKWGATSKGFGYSETLPLGFFNPRSYRWHGLAGGASWNGAERVLLSLDAEAGIQTIDGGAGTFSWDYSARCAWTPDGGRATLAAAWTQARAGLPVVAASGAYQEHTLTFTLRLRGGRGRLAP